MLIDPNFLQYALDSKKRQMATASPAELARLTAEAKELLVLLVESAEEVRQGARQ